MSAETSGPLCFVLMPFGVKPSESGGTIDFDAVYHDVIQPAIEQAGLRCIRADEETVGGIIHKPMFERLLICEYAVADLTAANANVYYELGVRHAVRPWSTILVSESTVRLPFDVAPLRSLRYHLDSAGTPSTAEADRNAVAGALRAAVVANGGATPLLDSPIFQLLDWFPTPDLDSVHAESFREEADKTSHRRGQLDAARRNNDVAAVRAVLDSLGDLAQVEVGVVIDLLLSFASLGAHQEMVDLVEQRMGPTVKSMTVVREQHGLALNRVGRRADAEQVLTLLIDERGPSSETYGLLGRVLRDRWQDAVTAGDEFVADELLKQAIAAYRTGFETDWRDPYPGVNALELMEVRDDPSDHRELLLPVVRFAVQRRLAGGRPTIWDHASDLEIAVLEGRFPVAKTALGTMLASSPATWELASTGDSIRRIRVAWEARGIDVTPLRPIEDRLFRDVGGAPAG